MKVVLKFEGNTFKNECQVANFDVYAGDFEVMIDTDRRRRAQEKGLPLNEVAPRSVQEICDELWRGEEAVAHSVKRGDRGKGRKRCFCGHGCKKRQGYRAPESFPESFDTAWKKTVMEKLPRALLRTKCF